MLVHEGIQAPRYLDNEGHVVVTGQQAAVVSLTDNTGGVANDTIAAIPDPADAPGTADVLRDDLVANTLPPIRDAVADLAAKVNELVARLRAAGTIAT